MPCKYMKSSALWDPELFFCRPISLQIRVLLCCCVLICFIAKAGLQMFSFALGNLGCLVVDAYCRVPRDRSSSSEPFFGKDFGHHILERNKVGGKVLMETHHTAWVMQQQTPVLWSEKISSTNTKAYICITSWSKAIKVKCAQYKDYS